MGEEKLYTIDVSLSPLDRINAYFECLAQYTEQSEIKRWDTGLLQGVRLLRAEVGKTEFEITITDAMCNPLGILHGGCASTLADIFTSTALFTVARPGFLDGHTVTRSLVLSFLRPVAVGSKIKSINEVVQAGKRTAHIKGSIVQADGRVCIECLHDKVVFDNSRL